MSHSIRLEIRHELRLDGPYEVLQTHRNVLHVMPPDYRGDTRTLCGIETDRTYVGPRWAPVSAPWSLWAECPSFARRCRKCDRKARKIGLDYGPPELGVRPGAACRADERVPAGPREVPGAADAAEERDVTDPTRIDVVFECGAMYRNVEGPFAARAIAQGTKPRKRDGRVSCVVYDSDRVGQSSPRRPTMPDGSPAPCRFGCPAKRASGRREMSYWPDETNSAEAQAAVAKDRTGPIRFPVYVTCYPSERPTEVSR